MSKYYVCLNIFISFGIEGVARRLFSAFYWKCKTLTLLLWIKSTLERTELKTSQHLQFIFYKKIYSEFQTNKLEGNIDQST